MSVPAPFSRTAPNTPVAPNPYHYHARSSQLSLPEASTSYFTLGGTSPLPSPPIRPSHHSLDAALFLSGGAQCRQLRPLPRIPGTSSTPSSTGSSPKRSLRPLPTPPVQSTSVHQSERRASPSDFRPLPCPKSTSTTKTATTSTTTRTDHNPQPSSSRVATSQLDTEPPIPTPPLSAPPSLSLTVPVPPGLEAPPESARTPDSISLSPIVFAGSKPLHFTHADTDTVRKRLSALGFVEVDSVDASNSPDISHWPTRDTLTSHNACLPHATRDIEIRVELVPSLSATTTTPRRRMSRFWVREKKGKRWVESDHAEILQELRKL